MNILFCIPRLEIGGAEVFLVRLATYLKGLGHKCYILETSEYARKDAPLKRQLKNIPVFNLTGPKILYKIIDKIDKEAKTNKYRAFITGFFAKRIIRKYNIDVLNTHVFSADYWISQAFSDSEMPVVITMHGCYEKSEADVEKSINTLLRSNAVIYIAEKNLGFIEQNRLDKSVVMKKIYNGYSQSIDENEKVERSEINCNTNDFIFVMVARGLKEKGWSIAINAFSKLNAIHSHIKLVLIGDGEYLEELKEKSDNKNIIFLGSKNKPQVYMQISDVGLLPTYYQSESLPNSVTEYLYNGLPVIASNMGDIKNMLTYNDSTAGIVINDISADTLFNAMQTYVLDRDLYKQHKNLTKEAVKKFEMGVCAAEYIKLFESVSLVK